VSLAGKKIACFVALPHHTRFLSPVMDAARKQGAKIRYFTTMSDYPFERDLVKRGEECKLIQSYADDETRRKLKEATCRFYEIWADKCLSWDGYRHWPFVLQSALVTNGFEEYFCLDNFFKQEAPDMVVALHERNRWGKLLGHYTSTYGIPYVTLQEGDYYEDRISFSGHTEYSTALMLWGRATAERLVRLKSTPEKMVSIGNTHLGSVREAYFNKKKMDETRKELGIAAGKKVVLFLVGLQWGVIKDGWVWEEFMGDLESRDDIVPVFKWHPKVTYSSYKKNTEDFFKQRFPSCVVVQNYDPYRLLPIADFCVTLGKTTLAVEAMSFGKPVFSLPGRDGSRDHYAALGISQEVWPVGDWTPLYNAIDAGVPPSVKQKLDVFMNNYFYRNNAVVIERSLDVLRVIFEARQNRAESVTLRDNPVPQRFSYIVPGGDDPEALLLTLRSLSEHVTHRDWEVVIVANHPDTAQVLSALSGDLEVVYASGTNLAELYNRGAAAASGAILVFVKPGVAYFRDTGLAEGVRQGVTGIPLYNSDATPFCLGIGYDFNSVPFQITDTVTKSHGVGGGLLAVHRDHFAVVGGFDARVANHLIEPDFCLATAARGIKSAYLHEGAAIFTVDTFPPADDLDDGWRGRIAFFAKWAGRLPKNDDFLSFAADQLGTPPIRSGAETRVRAAVGAPV
jgi:hypothetical protein